MNRKVGFFALISLISTSLLWTAPAIPADVPEVDPDLGLVVFYRPSSMKGGAITFQVNHSDGGSLGTLSSGSVVYDYFEPGEVTFYSQVISKDALTINVEAGKVYFVRADSKIGLVVARPKFKRVDDKTGRAAVAKI
jgi:hypothetical protein